MKNMEEKLCLKRKAIEDASKFVNASMKCDYVNIGVFYNRSLSLTPSRFLEL